MMNIIDLFPYMKSAIGTNSLMCHVPISKLNEVRLYFKSVGVKTKIRFRGPRVHNKHRTRYTNQGSCLKQDAVKFAVYKR